MYVCSGNSVSWLKVVALVGVGCAILIFDNIENAGCSFENLYHTSCRNVGVKVL